MANVLFNALKAAALKADIDFESDTIKVRLVTSAHTPDQNAHDFRNDIANDVSGVGSTAGGATATNKTVTQDSANNRALFDADDVT